MSAKHLIRAFNSSSKAADAFVDLPSLCSVLPVVLWFRRIRRVSFQSDFLIKLIYLIYVLLFSFCITLFYLNMFN